MSRVIKNIDADYTVFGNGVYKHGLHLKSIGLLAYMLSLPKGWNFSINGLATILPDGPDSIKTAIKELEEKGFLKRIQPRDGTGKFGENDWMISDKPMTNKPLASEPLPENPLPESQPQLNTNKLSIKELNTKELNTKDSCYTTTKRFQKPTLEEIANYCNERHNNVDPAKFRDYYEANGWKVGRNPMRDWKATVRTWERNEKGFSAGFTQQKKKGDWSFDDF